MITGVIKNKVDKIWTDIWAGGITNPLTVIEQLTYLMFIRSLDEKELETEEYENMMGSGVELEKIFPNTASGQAMRWSKFKDRDPREIYDLISQRVFPAIKNFKNGKLPDFTPTGEMIEVEEDANGSVEDTAFSRYMSDAMFLIPTPQVLQKIITGLDDLYENDISDLDMQGDLYEYMLGKLSTAGQNGQFRTPRHIIQMMVGANAVEHADKLIFITTSDYTPSAVSYAQECNVELINGNAFLEMLDRAGMFTGQKTILSLDDWQLTMEDLKPYFPEDIYRSFYMK